MLAVMPDVPRGFVEIMIDGRISFDEFDAVAVAIDAAIARHGRIHLLEVIRSRKSMSLGLWLRDLKFSAMRFGRFARYGMVTENGGSVGPVSKFFTDLASTDMRIFAMRDLDEARAWVRGDPVSS